MTTRNGNLLLLLAASVALAGCGQSREQKAVAACEKAAADKLTGKTYELDTKDMLAKATSPDANTVQINSVVYFDRGLPAESKQQIECRVQYDPNNANAEPVAFVQFIW
jgi:hypothetical protein